MAEASVDSARGIQHPTLTINYAYGNYPSNALMTQNPTPALTLSLDLCALRGTYAPE